MGIEIENCCAVQPSSQRCLSSYCHVVEETKSHALIGQRMMAGGTHQTDCRIQLAGDDRFGGCYTSAHGPRRCRVGLLGGLCIEVQRSAAVLREKPYVFNIVVFVHPADLLCCRRCKFNVLKLLPQPGLFQAIDNGCQPSAVLGVVQDTMFFKQRLVDAADHERTSGTGLALLWLRGGYRLPASLRACFSAASPRAACSRGSGSKSKTSMEQ